MRIFLINGNEFAENCYIVINEQDVTLIDPGFNYDNIVGKLDELNLSVNRIFLTHGHIDHTGDIDKLSKKYPNVPIYIHEFDKELLFDETLNCSKQMDIPKEYSKSLNIITVKNDDLIEGYRIYLTPGHTKGSIVIYYLSNDGIIFTGDTLFKNSIGRTDLPTGSMIDIEKSLEYIKKSFSKSINILPGHYSKTTLKDEIKNNPYLNIKKRK